jgi:hypothetical protein
VRNAQMPSLQDNGSRECGPMTGSAEDQRTGV